MGERDIDKYFQDKLKGYAKDVDTDAIFSALDLPEKKKKRPFVLWIAGLFFVVFLGGTYYVSGIFSSQQEEQLSTIDSSALQNKNNESIATPIAGIQKKSESEIISDPSSSLIENSPNELTNAAASMQYNKVAYQKTSTLAPPQTLSENQAEVVATMLNNDLDYKSLIEHSGPAVIPQRTFAAGATSKQEKKSLNLTSHSLELLNTNKLPSYLFLAALEVNPKAFLSIPEREISELRINTIHQPISRVGNSLSLNIYSGLYNLDRTLIALHPDSDRFLAQKENTETPLELISAGAQLQYNFRSLYLKTGMEIQSLNERFEYEQLEVLDTVAVPGIVGILVDANGNFINQAGTVRQENTLTSTWRHHNNYHLITIPFCLGYEKNINRWYLSIEAQTLVNIHRRFSGKQLDSSNSVTEVSSISAKSFQLGYGLSVGVRYAMDRTTFVYLRPHYFWYKDSSISVGAYTYSQKYNMYGLQLGLSYKLF